MRDDDFSLLLIDPTRGLSYQVAGALQRLGKRMAGLLNAGASSDLIKHVPMPNVRPGEKLPSGLTHALMAPHPELSWNQPVQNWNTIWTRVESLPKDLTWIWVLPMSTPAAHLKTVHDRTRAIVMLTPALFGFRDDAILDGLLSVNDDNSALIEKAESLLPISFPLAYAGDVAALVASAVSRADLAGRTLKVPAITTRGSEFIAAFRRHFGASVPLWNRVRAAFASKPIPWPETLLSSIAVSAAPTEAVDVFEVFPAAPTPLDRAMRELATHRKRNPEMGLVHPPARGL